MKRVLSNEQHAEDCECATCELGGGFGAAGRQRAIDWTTPEPAAREKHRQAYEVARVGPRVADMNRVLRDLERAKKHSAPSPGGFREWLKQKKGPVT